MVILLKIGYINTHNRGIAKDIIIRNLQYVEMEDEILIENDYLIRFIEKEEIDNTIFEEKYFSLVQNKSTIWNKANKYKNYALFADENNVIGIEFDDEGKSINKSYLLINEELEINIDSDTITGLSESIDEKSRNDV